MRVKVGPWMLFCSSDGYFSVKGGTRQTSHSSLTRQRHSQHTEQ